VDTKTIVDALSSATDAQLERIGFCFWKGVQRAIYEAEHPRQSEPPAKPKRLVLPEIVARIESMPETDAAITEWEERENHAASCEGFGCQRCKAWAKERARRVRRLSDLYQKARQAGMGEPDVDQLSVESQIPASVITSMLAEVRR